MSEIHPSSDAFEQLKQFCFRIGEGRIEPREDGVHYMLLYHPIRGEDGMLLVHYDGTSNIYVREFPEGMSVERLEDLPLVHSFRGKPIFPSVVNLFKDRPQAYYRYFGEDGEECHSSMVPLAQYERFKGLFDEINPMPWVERKDPDSPVVPDV